MNSARGLFRISAKILHREVKKLHMSSTVKDILKIAIPVSVENLIANTGTFILTVFLSRMGEKQVTVNGIANQGSFLVILFLFGLNTGGAIFVSQYWGKKDREGIKRTSTLMIYSSLIIALGFFCSHFLLSRNVLFNIY